LKEAKHKFSLLKTVCAMLNSKGGTIYIGAEDNTGEVKGVSLLRK
jgi:predicted HTH transcriptional regulator